MGLFKEFKIKSTLKKNSVVIRREYEIYPDYIKNDFRVIKKILNESISEKIDYKLLVAYLKEYPEDIINVSLISEKEYLKLFETIPKLIDYLNNDDEIFLVAKNTNIMLSDKKFQLLKQDQKIALINKNIEYYYLNPEENKTLVNMLDDNIQLQIYEKDSSILEQLSDKIKLELGLIDDEAFKKLPVDMQLEILLKDNSKLLLCDNYNLFEKYIIKITEKFKNYYFNDIDIDNFSKLYKKGVKTLKIIRNKRLLDLIASSRLKNHPKTKEFIMHTETIQNTKWKLDDHSTEIPSDIEKDELLYFFNYEILENNSDDVLLGYLNDPSPAKLEIILENTYGNHVRTIFKNRHNLNISTIDDPKLFNSKIYNELGIDFINQVINYEIDGIECFLSIIEDENLLNNYKKMYDYMRKEMGEGIETISLSIKKFIDLRKILKDNDFNDLLNNYKFQLNNLIFDEANYISIDNLNKLDDYLEIRDELSIKTAFLSTKQFLMSILGLKEEFNMLYDFTKENIDTNSILTPEELETINEIIFIADNLKKEKLSQLVEIMADYPTKYNPLAIKKICNKIKKFYIDDFQSQITNDEKIMEENNSRSIIDGVEVIDFKGENFHFLLSGVRGHAQAGQYFSTYEKFSNKELVNKWLFLEDGCSTISTALASETYLYGHKTTEETCYDTFFGFNSFDSNQIICFGSMDMGALHGPRKVYQGGNKYFSTTYKQCMYEMDYNKKSGINKTNETVIKRYKNNGERVLPDFIAVYSDNPTQLTNAIEIAKEFAKINHPIKIYRIYPEYYKNKSCRPDNRISKNYELPKTELIKRIKSILIEDKKDNNCK